MVAYNVINIIWTSFIIQRIKKLWNFSNIERISKVWKGKILNSYVLLISFLHSTRYYTTYFA